MSHICVVSLIAALTACGGGSSHSKPDGGGGDGGMPDGPTTSPVAPGADPTFGAGGLATIGFPDTYEAVARVCAQSDGKIVAVGGSEETVIVARVGTDGSFDSGFGSGGLVQLPWGIATSGVSPGYGCAIQSDGKIVIAAHIVVSYRGAEPVGVVVRLAADGSIDTSFGQSGLVIGGTYSEALSVAVQSDGKIVVGGLDRIDRYNSDGTADTSFGTNGTLAGGQVFQDLVRQGDGSIVGVGSNTITRVTAAGQLDSTFGTGGTVSVATAGDANLYGVALQGDGSILAGGLLQIGGRPSFWVGRYTPAGALDTTFGGGVGYVVGDSGTSGAAVGVGVDSAGRIVALGSATVGGHTGTIVRYTSAGAVDTTFGTQGVTTGLSLEYGDPVFDGADNISSAGATVGASLYSIALARTTSTGAGDATFGTNGVVTRNASGSFDRAQAIALQPDGKVLLAGVSYASGGGALVRLDADGTPDATFGTNGSLFVPSLEHVNGVAVQADGSIVVSGPSAMATFVVERITSAGVPDTSFGTGGVVTSAIVTGDPCQSQNLAIGSGGTIVVVGYTYAAGGTIEYGALELAANGTPSTTFGTNGTATTAFGTTTLNAATNAVVQSDGSVVVLGIANGYVTLSRFTPTGAIDAAFGAPRLPVTGSLQPYALLQQADGSLVAVAGEYTNGALVIARYTSAGVLDTGFGTAGVVTLSLGGNDYIPFSQPMGLVELAGGKLELGVAAASSDGLVERGELIRLDSDGTLDASFGTGGVLELDLGPGSSSVNALAVQPDGKVVAAGRVWTASGGSDFMALRFLP